MSRIAFSCVSKRNHEPCFVSELLHRGGRKKKEKVWVTECKTTVDKI